MTEISGLCGLRLTKAWMVATLAFGTIAFGGQEIRWVPVRTGELGSLPGTVGDPVEAEFNVDLGCWELVLPAGAGGFEVDLDLQAMGWGSSNCVQPTGLCRLDPGDDCTVPSDCGPCISDAGCAAGTCTDNGATCLESDLTGSGDPCISHADCTQGTERCRGRLGPCSLGAIQATVAPAGYDNGSAGVLNPKGWPGNEGIGAYQPKNTCEFGGGGEPCSPPFDPTCTQQGGGICVSSPRYVMPGCAGQISAIATPTLDYAWAVAAQTDCATDDGQVKTFGGLILEVPANAAGTYRIDFDLDPNNSFMTAGNGVPIAGVVFTPACITLVCESDADCGDGIPCTTDICSTETSTCENSIVANSCRIDGTCYTNGEQEPEKECRVCDSNLSQTDWSSRAAGFACGDVTDSDCDNPDTCDGEGACQDNLALEGSACEDQTETACSLADTCDAAGTCLSNDASPGSPCADDGNDCTRDLCSAGNCTHRNWAVGTPCGDATDVPCDGADTCDGIGSCLNNVLPDETPCPNENFCDGAELCLDAVCQPADPPCDPEDDLCDEQDNECDLLGDHDGDLLITQSDFLHWQDCETGPVGGPYAAGCEIFDFEQNDFVDLRDYARFQIAFTMP